MTKKTYSEKLKDPRWQKQRLRILEKDKFSCELCGDEKSTLHIHHKLYRDCDPWEYEENELATLCVHCHRVISSLVDGKLTDGSLELLKFTKFPMGKEMCLAVASKGGEFLAFFPFRGETSIGGFVFGKDHYLGDLQKLLKWSRNGKKTSRGR